MKKLMLIALLSIAAGCNSADQMEIDGKAQEVMNSVESAIQGDFSPWEISTVDDEVKRDLQEMVVALNGKTPKIRLVNNLVDQTLDNREYQISTTEGSCEKTWNVKISCERTQVGGASCKTVRFGTATIEPKMECTGDGPAVYSTSCSVTDVSSKKYSPFHLCS